MYFFFVKFDIFQVEMDINAKNKLGFDALRLSREMGWCKTIEKTIRPNLSKKYSKFENVFFATKLALKTCVVRKIFNLNDFIRLGRDRESSSSCEKSALLHAQVEEIFLQLLLRVTKNLNLGLRF